jgi:hypothetical protein
VVAYSRGSSFYSSKCITSDSAISAESANLVGETKVEPSDRVSRGDVRNGLSG